VFIAERYPLDFDVAALQFIPPERYDASRATHKSNLFVVIDPAPQRVPNK
jgi:hypothetical protein